MAEPTADERKRLFEAIAEQYGRADQQRRDTPISHMRYSKRDPGMHRGGRKYHRR